ncbi:MAG: VOC family protein [Halioglobus sp.]|nr:VOC family protein [Halioglobus sp.]
MEPRISIITLGVADLDRSLKFYRDGLGFTTNAEEGADIVFFRTSGTCLALYPRDQLAEDVAPGHPGERGPFPGITMAHNTREKAQVDEVLAQAEQAGGKILKPAQDVFWGGYSGYFADPDGYLWEVAYSDGWQFNADGSLVIE